MMLYRQMRGNEPQRYLPRKQHICTYCGKWRRS